MSIEFVTGDLFAAPNLYAFAHGCNCAGSMGRGIAVSFRDRWPEMYEEYRRRCLTKRFQPGDVFLWTDGRYRIFNLGTQLTWKTRAEAPAIQSALTGMIDSAIREKVPSIGLPRIGAGLGGLAWEVVRELLVEASRNTEVRLIVFENYVPTTVTPKKQGQRKRGHCE